MNFLAVSSRVNAWMKQNVVSWFSRFARAVQSQRRWIGFVALAFVIVVGGVYALLPSPTAHGSLKGRRVEIHRNANIHIVFDQDMYHVSVEQAFSISPAVKGKFSWEKNELTFTPEVTFEKGATYEVTIGDGAKNTIGKGLRDMFRQSFFVLDFPDVAVVAPADKSEISSSQTLTVLFDHPIRTLTRTVVAPAELLKITPTVKGMLRYLGTSGIEFVPDTGWPDATDFTATVPKGTKMADGSVLIADVTWSFGTAPLRASQSSYAFRASRLGISQPLRIGFNYPVRADVVRRALVVTANDVAVPNDQYTVTNVKDEPTSILIKPIHTWALGTTYAAQLPQGFTAGVGAKGLVSPWSVGSKTDERGFKFSSSNPNDGETIDLRNSISVHFNNLADEKTVKDGVRIDPAPEDLRIMVSHYDSSVRVNARWTPSTKYTVLLTSKLKDVNGQSLDGEKRISFETQPYAPSAAFATYGAAMLAANQPHIYQLQTMNLHAPVTASICSGTFEEYAADKKFTCALQGEKRYETETLLNRYKIIDMDLDEVVGKKLPNGYYTFTIDIPELPDEYERNQSRIILVTDIALTLKRDKANTLLVWATNMQTGDVVPNLTVDAVVSSKHLAKGTTNAQGIAMLKLPENSWEDTILVRAQDRTHLGIASTSWNEGITPWNYGLDMNDRGRGSNRHIGYLYTDRRIYRPDQMVFYKGVIRQDVDAKLTVPNLKDVTVTIQDSENTTVETKTLPLSGFGTFNGSFQLHSEMPLGTYRFFVAPAGDDRRIEGTFDVREYRRPDFKVTVNTPQDIVTSGQNISLNVRGEYFHGTPLGGANVTYEVTRNALYFQPIAGEWYSYSALEQYDCYWECRTEPNFEQVISGEGVLDAQGNFTINLPANLTDYKSSATYSMTVTVTDVNQRRVSANVEFPVHKGEFYLGIRPNYDKGWAAPMADFDIVSVKPDGAIRVNAPATVKFFRRTWANVKKTGTDGTTSWTYEKQDALLETKNVTTDAFGRAQASFATKDDGEYVAVAETTDSRGSRITASVSRYVYRGYGIGSMRVTDDHMMRLIQNKADYAPGDTASLVVQTPYEKTNALVTVERETIREYHVVEIGPTQRTVKVPITNDSVPNIFVSVLAMKGGGASGIPEFRMGYAKLQVKTSQNVLDLKLTPDKTVYKPREKATFTIVTKRADGKPISAEVSIAVVDERVVSLLGSIDKNILGAFYFPRLIGVSTAQSLNLLLKKVFFPIAGAGGGKGEEVTPTIRGNFLDTAYWKADVVTGADGTAVVSFAFPDNLTSWQVLAIGSTKETIVGAAETKVVTRRDLMVEPLVPRILRHGDTAVIGATVHNTTNSSQTVNITLSAEGIKIDGSRDRSVTVPAQSRMAVNWTVRVPLNGFRAKVTVLAKSENLEDGFETSFPILPFSVAEVIGTSGVLEKSVTESFETPEDILKDVGHLNVSVTPNVGNGLSDGLGYLVDFEYGCSEQTTSAILASLAYSELVTRKITKPDDALMGKAKAKIEEGLKRLVAMQKSDGGWGLWSESEQSTPHYSAYVFWGLTRAAKVGFTVDPLALDRADRYLRESLSRSIESKEYEQLSANERAQTLYTLSERDPRDLAGYAASLYEKRSLLSGFGKSFLAITLGNVDKITSSSRVNTLLGEVAQKIERRDPTHISFKEDAGYESYWSSDTRSAAIYLQALLRLDPKNRDIEPLVRSLMEKKRDGYWESTQSTAMSFLALAEYATAHPITGDATNVEVFLQNQSMGYLKYPLGSLSASQSKLIPMSEVLKRGPKVQVGLEKESDHRYFYDVTLKTYRAIQDIAPFENGFSLISDIYALKDTKREHPLTAVLQGDTVRVRLKLLVPKTHTYVALESHLPAGLEAIDVQLKTSPQNIAGETKQCAPTWRGEQRCLSDWENGWWWENVWKHIELRDDRVFLFSERLEPGVYEYEFLVQAITPGEFRVPPARVYEFYNPQSNAHTEGKILTVNAK